MNIPWQLSSSSPSATAAYHEQLRLALSAPSPDLLTMDSSSGTPALPQDPHPHTHPHHHHRTPTSCGSSKTDTDTTNSLSTPSDEVWTHPTPHGLPTCDTDKADKTNFAATSPTTHQMMDILFPALKQHRTLPYAQQDCLNGRSEYNFATAPFTATHLACSSPAPFTFDSCPDESCTINHGSGTNSSVCCNVQQQQQQNTAASSACSVSGDDAYAAMCCSPTCSTSMDALLPCEQGGSSFLCADASCSDPSCDQPFASTSKVTLPITNPHTDSCVSVCDGVVQEVFPEIAYQECGDCNVGDMTAEQRGNFAQSLHNLFLDCCRECPDEHFDPCCPSAQPHQLCSTSTADSGVPTPTATLGAQSTPDTLATGTPAHPTPQSHLTESPIPPRSAHVEMALRDDCRFGQPHPHDASGYCLAPHMTLWKQHGNDGVAQIPSNRASAFQPKAAPNTISCKWAGCSHICSNIADLAAHVHSAHLVPQETVSATSPDLWQSAMPSGQVTGHPIQNEPAKQCQWDSCSDVHLPYRGAATTDAVLAHLFQAHLGQQGRTSWTGISSVCSSSSSPSIPQGVPSSLSKSSSLRKQIRAPINSNSKKQRSSSAHGALQSRQGRKKAPSTTSARSSKCSSSVESGDEPCSPTRSSSCAEGHDCGWVGCSEHFESHQALTDHIAQDHVGGGKSSYTCGWVGCQRGQEGKTFQQRQKILRHLQTHTGDRPYKCTICSRRFSEANTLSQHMRTHTHEKPYLCDYPGCSARFAVAGSLTIHKRSRHTNERPFVCTWPGCKRAFAESSNLTKHRRVHSGERPFACERCDRRFSRPDQLSRHVKIHEPKVLG